MDLATYIRELRETERSLRSRLKPTIAMMKITSFVLAPVVLGVTFAMYMTLGAIAGSGPGSLSPGMFFLVLDAAIFSMFLSRRASFFWSKALGSTGIIMIAWL